MKLVITLTDAAVDHIQQMISKDPKKIGFRLSLKKTGCSGFAYVPDLVSTPKEHDLHFTAQKGLDVYVDPDCKDFVKDLMIDYVDDNNAGIKQKRLVFINPNEKNRCGCGESFTIE